MVDIPETRRTHQIIYLRFYSDTYTIHVGCRKILFYL